MIKVPENAEVQEHYEVISALQEAERIENGSMHDDLMTTRPSLVIRRYAPTTWNDHVTVGLISTVSATKLGLALP